MGPRLRLRSSACAAAQIAPTARERAPGATGYVKLDTDTWVINLPLLLRAVEGALHPKSTDGEHRRGVWGKCTAELTLKPSSRYYERKNKSGVFMGNTFEHRQRLCE